MPTGRGYHDNTPPPMQPRAPNPWCRLGAAGRGPRYIHRPMLHYFKFRQDLFAPRPGKDVYVKRGRGKGWPEECPPIRAANAFGFDLLANFDVTFVRGRGGWKVEPDVVIASDFDYAAGDESS